MPRHRIELWTQGFSEIATVTSRLYFDQGGSFINLCSDGDNNCFRNSFKSYLNYVKECDSGSFMGNCWVNNGGIKYLRGVVYGEDWDEGDAGLILSDGAFLDFYDYRASCNKTLVNGVAACGEIYVDVNGFKKPNTLGKDIYLLRMLKSGIAAPSGGIYDNDDCSSSNDGWNCATKVLQEIDY
ncbi:MAG: hypothetical protein A2287_05000 [Candidatus Melainabacteria bacterium RIFOXYA12_FULL_32_12]|nr:MAG: hypothetical protein A2255_00130 [Candidatus Melainabacteria bacterium RIFOXYA2_FULL_32_9]OGI29942.1 MAG: hypothetical protein A2287_05000 [Candidatus Melainabacteria bacterium RIFOXYA12_FULL_32_12]